jgi:hypothetical protein
VNRQEKINKEISRQQRILRELLEKYPYNVEYDYEIGKQQGFVRGLELAAIIRED